MSTPLNTENLLPSGPQYLEYIDGVTGYLLTEFEEEKVSPEKLRDYADSLICFPLVRQPHISYEKLESPEQFLDMHLFFIKFESVMYGEKFFEYNEVALNEIRSLMDNVSDRVRDYAAEKGINGSDLNAEEIYTIILAEKERQEELMLINQVLSGITITAEELEWRRRLHGTCLPNVVQALRILNFLEEYNFPTP